MKIEDLIRKYNRFLLPLGLIIASIFLIFSVIMPQFGLISEKQVSLKVQEGTLQSLSTTLETISKTNDEKLDADFATAVKALPSTKDVALIFSGLSDAAAKSNTEVRGFTLTVGGIYGRAATLPEGIATAPVVSVQARISGSDTESLIQFSRSIIESLPLAEIKKISATGPDATYEINFFYKPVNSTGLAKKEDVKPLTQTDQDLLNKLAVWEN